MHDAAGAVLGSRVLILGGGASDSVGLVQSVTADGRTSIVGQLPRVRSDATAVAANRVVLVLGGYDGSTLDPSVLRSTDGRGFVRVATLPVPVRYPAVVVADGAVWLAGGQTGAGPTNVVQEVVLRTGAARVVGRLPEAVSGAVAFVLGGSIYVCGGADAAGAAQRHIWRVVAGAGVASPVGLLPQAVAYAAATTVGDSAYLFGGEGPGLSDAVIRVGLVHRSGA